MKFLYCCLLLLAAIVASEAYTASWGRRNNTDILLYRQTEKRVAQKNRSWNIFVDYPTYGGNQNIISAITVYDNFRNNSGAIPNVVSGGVGYRYTRIQLIGKVNQGIDSTIEIYGRR